MKDSDHSQAQWVYCNQCLRDTRHEVITERKIAEKEVCEIGPGIVDIINWTTTYTMLECRGCGAVTLRKRLVSHEWSVDETTCYPPAITRKIPRWHHELRGEFKELLVEAYEALDAGCERLAVMGARTIVDLFMTRMLGDIGGFEQKLDELAKRGYLSKWNRDTLHAALEAGHAVIHRGHKPTTEQVNLVFDIVENLLHIGVLQRKSKILKKDTPPRKKRKGQQNQSQ